MKCQILNALFFNMIFFFIRLQTKTFIFLKKKDLIDLGLPIGEVYLLLDKFKNTTSFDSKKQKLQCLIRNIKTTKVTRVVKETLQVHLKWHNFNKKKNKFAMQGGQHSWKLLEIISLLEKPPGKSKKLEKLLETPGIIFFSHLDF